MDVKIKQRHKISDYQWSKIKEFLPGRKGTIGRPAKNNRNFVDAIVWRLKTGSPWRDIPEHFGDWCNIYIG